MEQCPETSAYKTQIPGNYPEENIQHTEHGESLKSSVKMVRLSGRNYGSVTFLSRVGGIPFPEGK
jgi:hypothetical protein